MSDDQTRITIQTSYSFKRRLNIAGAEHGIDTKSDIYKRCLELGVEQLEKLNKKEVEK